MRKIKLLSYLAIVCLCMAGCSNSDADIKEKLESVETESTTSGVLDAVIDSTTDGVINVTTDSGEKIEIDTNLESTDSVKEEDGSTTYTTEDGTTVNVKDDGTATVTPATEQETTTKPTEQTQKPTESTQNPNKTETETTKKPEPEKTPIKTPTHTHSYTSNVTKEATCTTKGVKTYTCTCGDSYTEDIVKTSHIAGDWSVTKNATCKETGSKVKKCTVCGTQMETANVEKTGHTAGDWTVTKAATCNTNGTKVKKCTVCGVETANETIVANGTHNYYWDGDNTMRTHRCSGCSYTGVTEYNINGAWGYFDDAKASDLWYYVNDQRQSVKTVIRDHKGNPIGDSTIPALNKNSELDAKAKNRAVAAALNFDHAGEQHECLAWGIGSGMDVVTAWTMSTSHRVAMTSKDYTQGGVAWFYYDSDNSGFNLTPIAVLELGY